MRQVAHGAGPLGTSLASTLTCVDRRWWRKHQKVEVREFGSQQLGGRIFDADEPQGGSQVLRAAKSKLAGIRRYGLAHDRRDRTEPTKPNSSSATLWRTSASPQRVKSCSDRLAHRLCVLGRNLGMGLSY